MQPPLKIIEDAKKRIGIENYNLLSANCQNFCAECRYKISKSNEVDFFFKSLMIASSLFLGYKLVNFYVNRNKIDQESEIYEESVEDESHAIVKKNDNSS